MKANIFLLHVSAPDVEVPGPTRALCNTCSADDRGAERRTGGAVMIPHQRLVRARGARSSAGTGHAHVI